MKIGVIGTGYVGLVTGTCFAEMGNEVICLDIDQKKIDRLKEGVIPIYEPGLEDMVIRCYKEKRLSFSTDYSQTTRQSDIIFIAVGTPPGEDGSADLNYVLKAAESIAQNMDSYKVIVNKSTVPVGTGIRVKEAIQKVLEKRKVDFGFDVVSNPEFLKEGTAIDDFMRPDRIVVGVESEKSHQMMARLYEPFVRNGHPILFMDVFSSEMTKYAANAMLATKISFINEVSRVCEKLGADVEKVRKGIGADKRIGHHFIYPGLGYGGSCFPKDVKALLKTGQTLDEPMFILDAVEKVNHLQRKHYIDRVLGFFKNQLQGKKIGIWGLAFKPGTDDIREAPSIDLIESLLKAGAFIRAYDPVAAENVKNHFKNHPNLTFVEEQYGATDGVDALCIVTEWKSFREPDFAKIKAKMVNPVVFDGRNQYNPEEMKELGFKYFCIGRKSV